jgi:hypothetical protein
MNGPVDKVAMTTAILGVVGVATLLIALLAQWLGERQRDWFKFTVHFFFGALVGALLGLRAWGRSSFALSTSFVPGLLIIAGGALLVGLIAGVLSNSGWDE